MRRLRGWKQRSCFWRSQLSRSIVLRISPISAHSVCDLNGFRANRSEIRPPKVSGGRYTLRSTHSPATCMNPASSESAPGCSRHLPCTPPVKLQIRDSGRFRANRGEQMANMQPVPVQMSLRWCRTGNDRLKTFGTFLLHRLWSHNEIHFPSHVPSIR